MAKEKVTEAKEPDLHFVRNILIASVVVLILSFYPVYAYASGSQTLSIVCGYLISLINVVIGYAMNEIALNKKVKNFMVMVFGGMLVRMVFVLLVLVLLLSFTDLDTISLVLSVFFFYFLFVSIEIHSLFKITHRKKVNSQLE